MAAPVVSLGSGHYDAVVVGGGAYGILLALEGAARDQRVLLVERDDFGGGATFNHLRTIHGGLRYLQSLDLPRAVTSNRQRLWWLQTFPDLVQPLTCLMPLYGEALRRAEIFALAFLLARGLGLHRDGTGKAGYMQILSTDEVAALLPNCRRVGLQRGALWQDAFMPKPHRVVAELLHWAESAGAIVCNYMEFLTAERGTDGAWRISLKSRRTGETVEIVSQRILNAAGASTDEVARRMIGRGRPPLFLPTLAWGLLLDRPPVSECSVAITPPGGGRRTYFVHPYHGRVLAGTGHAGVPAGAAWPAGVAHAQIEETLADLNEALPGVELTREQVRHVFSGILPGVRRGSDTLLKRPRIIDHGKRDGAPGAWTVIGVKFTEAPFVAARVWDALVGRQPRALPPRPPAVAVPSIVDARAMSDRELTIALVHLARAEWQASAEDLLWRRTDLWMDEALRRRAAGLARDATAKSVSDSVPRLTEDG